MEGAPGHTAAQSEAMAGGDAYRWVVLTAVASACFTVLVSVTSTISFAYRSPALHIAVETAAGIISLLAALLIYGRFQRSLAVRDLILAAGLFVSAVANLAFSTLPAVAGIDASAFGTWAPVGSRLFGAVLIAAAAFASARPLHHPHRDARRLLGACAGVLALIGTGVGLSAGLLPEAIDRVSHLRARLDPASSGIPSCCPSSSSRWCSTRSPRQGSPAARSATGTPSSCGSRWARRSPPSPA